MKTKEEIDYSEAPCKSIVTENIRNIEDGKALTAPLSYLNKSCEFKKRYDIIFGVEQLKKEEAKARMRAYRQKPEMRARMRAYYQKPEVKARMRAYYQRKKVEK